MYSKSMPVFLNEKQVTSCEHGVCRGRGERCQPLAELLALPSSRHWWFLDERVPVIDIIADNQPMHGR